MTFTAPPAASADDPADLADRGAPSDNDSVTGVLRSLAGAGFASSFRPAASRIALVCGTCQAITDASDLGVASERRLEGASDPDDMVLVIAAMCPICRTGGVIVLGYGPNASPEDSDIVAALVAPTPAEDEDDDRAQVADPGRGSGPDAKKGFES